MRLIFKIRFLCSALTYWCSASVLLRVSKMPRFLDVPFNTTPSNKGQRSSLNVWSILCRFVFSLLSTGIKIFRGVCMALIANPYSLLMVLAFAFISAGSLMWMFPALWNNTLEALSGSEGTWNNGANTANLRAENSGHELNVTRITNVPAREQIRADAEKDLADIHNQQLENDNNARQQRNKLVQQAIKIREQTKQVTREEGESISNTVYRYAEPIESYTHRFQYVPDITGFLATTCEYTAVTNGPWTYCLSPQEDRKPISLKQCDFRCVPHLSHAEFRAAMAIYDAEKRWEACNNHLVGVKAWFKLFNVIGHHNAKGMFASVFQRTLEEMCAGAAKIEELRKFESVRDVCGPFYKGSTLLLSNHQHQIAATAAVHDL